LYRASFDEAYQALGTNVTDTVTTDYGLLVSSWSGYALQRLGKVTPFVVPALNVAGRTNVACDLGTLSFWFKPYWSSASLVNGAGPGVNARLAEFVLVGNQESAVVWSLQSSADGSMLSLMSSDTTGAKPLLQAEIEWPAGEWRLVTLNYGAAGTELFIDGQRIALAACRTSSLISGGRILLAPSGAIGNYFRSAHQSFHGLFGAMARRFSPRSTAWVHFHLAGTRFLSVNIRLRL
jgi:hypothetical protein